MKIKFKEWDCQLEKASYGNDRLALYLVGSMDSGYPGENIATCTVNFIDEPLEKGYVHIKEWSENEGMTEALIKADVIEPDFGIIPVGPYGSFATLCKLKIEL